MEVIIPSSSTDYYHFLSPSSGQWTSHCTSPALNSMKTLIRTPAGQCSHCQDQIFLLLSISSWLPAEILQTLHTVAMESTLTPPSHSLPPLIICHMWSWSVQGVLMGNRINRKYSLQCTAYFHITFSIHAPDAPLISPTFPPALYFFITFLYTFYENLCDRKWSNLSVLQLLSMVLILRLNSAHSSSNEHKKNMKVILFCRNHDKGRNEKS